MFYFICCVMSDYCFNASQPIYSVKLTSDPDLHLEASPTEHIPLQAIHKLHQELQSLSKCFSGAQLTHWILRHSDLFLTEEELFLCEGEVEMTVQKALIIAQQMLDQHIILDIDTDNFSKYTSYNVCKWDNMVVSAMSSRPKGARSTWF